MILAITSLRLCSFHSVCCQYAILLQQMWAYLPGESPNTSAKTSVHSFDSGITISAVADSWVRTKTGKEGRLASFLDTNRGFSLFWTLRESAVVHRRMPPFYTVQIQAA